MNRRELMLAALAAPALGLPLLARAHHGWSSFDQERPIYLEGRVARSRWQNPHAELELEVPAGLTVPAGLAQRVGFLIYFAWLAAMTVASRGQPALQTPK